MSSAIRHSLHWLWLTLLVVLLDLGSKWMADNWLEYAQPVALLPVFDLTLLYNHGAAFSFLAGAGGWQRWFFAAVAVGVSVMLLLWLKRTPREQWWLGMAQALILGGALGNLHDRILHGYVVDFISLHYAGWYFPAFNIADSAITVGAVVLILDMFLGSRHAGHTQSEDMK